MSENKVRNEFNEALPQIFNREGLVKRNPNGNVAVRRDFNRIFATVQSLRASVLADGKSLTIGCNNFVAVCDTQFSTKLASIRDNDDQPDILAGLLLNGWKVSAE